MNPNTDFIPFAKPCFGPEEEAAVVDVLRSGWLTTGKKTLEFESDFARRLGVKHAVAVNSGTAGLHLAVEALGICADDYVVTTPYTFTASAEILRYLGAHPLFVDIEEATFNIDPEAVETILRNPRGKRIRGILPVHIGGYPCRMTELTESARRFGIPVIEDAAHAFPTMTDAGIAGTVGTAGMFSFYVTKPLATGEGGMIVTNDDAVASRMRTMRLHGIDRETWDRYTAANKWRYDVVAPGFKYNMTDLAAVIGQIQLRRTDEFHEKRQAIARFYTQAFSAEDYLVVPNNHEGHSWHLYLLRLDLERLSIDRDEFIQKLADLGIGVSVHFIPLHLMTYYKNMYGFRPDDFPRALRNYCSVVSLPIYPGLNREQQGRIVESVVEIGRKYARKGA